MSDSIVLAPIPESVAAARRWVGELLDRVGATEVADTMVLLVSELVSNVVLHAKTPCSLSVTRTDGGLRVEVADESDRLPGVTIPTDPLAQSGRGLQLVQGLSESYGVDPGPEGGKLVWFELAVGA